MFDGNYSLEEPTNIWHNVSYFQYSYAEQPVAFRQDIKLMTLSLTIMTKSNCNIHSFYNIENLKRNSGMFEVD